MKFFVAFCIILILNKFSVAQFKDGFTFKTSICDGKNGGLLPMFGTCRGYYVCNEGKAVVGSCDEYSRFNPLTLHCDDADKVKCSYEISNDDEDDEIDASESDQSELDSDEFEDPVVRPPLVVMPLKQKKPNKNLQNIISIDELCLGKKNGVTLPKSGSCTEYYVCKSRLPQLRSCPRKQHFSIAHSICMKPADAKCIVNFKFKQPEDPKSSPAITAGFCSENSQDALVPNREDCGKFLLCSNMMFLVMDCPPGLHFNVEARRCDYPKIAKCDVQKKQIHKNKEKISILLNKRKPKAIAL